jgi:hypothetical protein
MKEVVYQFEFPISEKDYLEFNVYYQDRLWIPFNNRLRYGLVAAGAFVLSLFIELHWFFPCFLFVFSVLSFSGLGTRWILKAHIRSTKKVGKLPYDNYCLYQFLEDSVVEIEDEAEQKIKYTKIEKVVTHKNMIYIFTSAVGGFIIPFSVFETNKQRKEFLTFIKDKADLLENYASKKRAK